MTILTLANGQTITTGGDVVEIIKPSKKQKARKGYILYRGKSVLDNAPIVVIATMETSNIKTGDMIQTWIMRDDVSPVEAVKEKLDSSVCGMCPHRHALKGGCYVQPFQAPYSIWKAYKKGNYKEFDKTDLNAFKGRRLRMGAYGDPAAVPFTIWAQLLDVVAGYTGYTHQVHHKRFDARIATICQISADTAKEAQTAWKKGFKTFRVKTEKSAIMEGEIVCLSDTHGITCLDCGLCNGKQANIVINAHGKKANRFDKLERII